MLVAIKPVCTQVHKIFSLLKSIQVDFSNILLSKTVANLAQNGPKEKRNFFEANYINLSQDKFALCFGVLCLLVQNYFSI